MLIAALLILLWPAATSQAQTERQDPTVTFIYPEEGQLIGAVDSSFVLGHVDHPQQGAVFLLTINGDTVQVHEGGGFIAWVPLEPGEFRFIARAVAFKKQPDLVGENGISSLLMRLVEKTPQLPPEVLGWVSDTLTVQVPEPDQPLPDDSLLIVGDYRPPSGNLALGSGEQLILSFRGTPGCRAWASIEGVVDSIPMSEEIPQFQPYWGEAVFGIGAVPESLMVAGVYTGFWEVPCHLTGDKIYPTYHLAPPSRAQIFGRLLSSTPSTNRASLADLMELSCYEPISISAGYRVSINSARFPVTVEFTDTLQVIRYGPRRGYFAIAQPAGVRALAIGGEGDWYRLRLAPGQYAWANRLSVKTLAPGLLPPKSLLRAIRCHSLDDRLEIEFPLSGKHPFRIIEESTREIRLQLFGVTSDTDWIRYEADDDLVEMASWYQPQEDVYEFRLSLHHKLWGYDTEYRGNSLVLTLKREPDDIGDLEHKLIVLDPGHSSDPGAIGPTGLTEAEVNLDIALELYKELRRHGADVVMTRYDDRNVPLYSRPAFADSVGADLFISIHNNALPDGVNPFENNGASVYYYHPHSLDLARAVHHCLLDEIDLPDHGLYHGNLAVARSTAYPAILIECAFMILPEQEAMLKDVGFRKKIARGIREGVERFLKDRKDER
ncbi:MAG TPA: N-acetylmuramoyl-L-alanine amidase [candidate division Zixibacteria bacterium]|nr:N-acetylmuramoyl-L-alanine amidase [candidate division Zixibacteria bacterium]